MLKRIQMLLILFVISSVFNMACTDTKQENVEEEATTKEETTEDKLLRHIVLFKFKDDAPEEEVQKISDAFNALPDALPVIKDFEWGLNDSPEDLHQDFTHCYLVTFASEEDRDSIYAPSPEHQAFVASLQPYIEKAFVVDYWVK